jgi:molybdopterin/thiamine biosynthesis adenylyltransferase
VALKFTEAVVVGLGGIGGFLVDAICKFISYKIMEDENYPSKIYLMDGDIYEEKNLSRQYFHPNLIGDFKANAKVTELQESYPNLELLPIPKWANIQTLRELGLEKPIILGCVDNHKTRNILSRFAETFNDVLYISGGNELIHGNVQVYIKEGGEAKTHTIQEFHPEIGEPKDRSPEEMSCEELAISEPQIIFCNLWAGLVMSCVLYNAMEGNYTRADGNIILPEETCFNLTTHLCLPKYRAMNEEHFNAMKKYNLI